MCGTITEETRVCSLLYRSLLFIQKKHWYAHYRSLLSIRGCCLVYQTIGVDSFVTSFLQEDIQVDSEFVYSTKY